MAGQLDAAAAGGGRASHDVYARTVVAVEVHVDGGEVAYRMAEVAGQVERLHEDLGEDDRRAEVQVDTARELRDHAREQVKVAQAAEPHGGAVRARMHVDDVGPDRDMHRHRRPGARRSGENARAAERQPLAEHGSAHRLTDAKALADAVADRLIEEGAGLVGHAEGAAVESRSDVLRGPAAPG